MTAYAMAGTIRTWREQMDKCGLDAAEEDMLKEIIDYILDNVKGAIPDKRLRYEMEVQINVFRPIKVFTSHEMWLWSFEKRFEGAPRSLLDLCKEAVQIKDRSVREVSMGLSAMMQ